LKRRINKVLKIYRNEGLIAFFKFVLYFVKYKIYDVLNNSPFRYKEWYREAYSVFRDVIQEESYEGIIFFDSRVGWNIPLFQRPQHMFNELADKGFLVIYRMNPNFDKSVQMFTKQKDNLYIVDFTKKAVMASIYDLLKKTDKPKLLSLYSTDIYLTNEYINETYTDRGFKMIYEYIDELSHEISGDLPEFVFERHNKIISDYKNCVVLASADKLFEEVKEIRGERELALATNGVRLQDWTAINYTDQIPEKLLDIKLKNKPIIGYYGALAKWFDYELIRKLSKERPDYEIVLIGFKYDKSMNNNKIEKLENVNYLGIIPYKELASYACHMDVLTIPFILNDITESTSPVKLFEYMALGKPIVTTDMRECRKYKSVMIAKSHEEFINLIDKSLKIEADNEYFNILKKEALENTWSMKATIFHDAVIESFGVGRRKIERKIEKKIEKNH